jgi:hypothetical protein
MGNILDEIRRNFDPTDADAASALSEHCKNVLIYAARALWAEQHGMRMGRDDSRELSIAIQTIAVDLGVLAYRYSGAEVDGFWKKLWAETGLDAPTEATPDQPKGETR